MELKRKRKRCTLRDERGKKEVGVLWKARERENGRGREEGRERRGEAGEE